MPYTYIGLVPLTGQGALYFTRYSTSEGLPSNNVGPMANDPDGFLWVGTRSGLARFDGQHFTSFRNLRPQSMLPEESVITMVADGRDRLWVQFPKQLFRISMTTFEAVPLPENLTPQCMDDMGRVYFNAENGVAVFREKERDFQRFPLLLNGKAMASRLICKGKNGLLLVATEAGIFRFSPKENTYERVSGLDDIAPHVLEMETDETGLLWLSNWSSLKGSVVWYDPYADRVLRVFHSTADGISTTDLNDILPDGDNVWMATNSGGLCRYSKQENRFYRYFAQPNVEGYLGSEQVGRLLKDHFGNLWVSSPFFLYKNPAHRTATELLSYDAHQPNSLIAPHCTNIAAVSDEFMVFGTLTGLSIFDRKKRLFRSVRLPAYSDYNNHITAFANTGLGGFWVSSWTGLYRLDVPSGRILEDFATRNGASTSYAKALKRQNIGAIRRLCYDRQGMLWAANYSNQAFRLDERDRTHKFVPIDTLVADTLPLNDHVEAFLDFDERYFLLGTLDGVVCYDRVTQRFELCPAKFPGLTPPLRIESLARTHNGDVLCIANGRPFRLTQLGAGMVATPLPLPGEVLQAQHILEDRLGNVWITTENGVVQINGAATFCQFYDSRNYLNDNLLLIRPTVIPAQDADGHLYFGGSRGVSVLNPQDFNIQQSQVPPVKIIGLSINAQPADLDSAIHRLSTLRLPYDQNNLAFAFAALSSTVPERNRFAYRLNGGDWVDLGNQNTVNFSRLAPGDYVLQIKAANSDGVWNEQGVQLHICIQPPWWRSWAAYFVYLMLLGWALRRYLKFRENRLQMFHQLEAERKEAERLQELDHFKGRFFANISHEFRTPLTVILGMSLPSGAGQEEAGRKAEERFRSIHRNGQNLLRLINQILDLAKMEESNLKLQPEQADMVAFCRYIVESLHSLSEMKNIPLHFEPETREVWMDFDLEKMQSVLFNLLSNALKFTPAGGDIYLSIARREKSGEPQCCIRVRDTGLGIPADRIERIFDRFYRVEAKRPGEKGAVGAAPVGLEGTSGTGIGLALTRELVRLMGGEILVESREGVGTTFDIVLPITTHAARRTDTNFASMAEQILPAPSRLAAAPPLPESAPSLLIVEDNDDVREYLLSCVADHYRVLQARHGREGIEMAFEHTPDLIVSDVMMPEKDGFELCQTLKHDERTSHIPVVLLTAKASVESRIVGLSRGADAYLGKPFHREELLLTLGNLFRARQVLQAHLRATLQSGQSDVIVDLAPQARVEDAFVQKVRAYVLENLGKADLSMDELSQAMTMSYQNLHRKLTALTQLSPVQFIRLIRLQKAKVLLETTHLSIGDIAFEVGFSDPKYFSRVFTEEFGCPPSVLRGNTVR